MLVKTFVACALAFVVPNTGTLCVEQPLHNTDFNFLATGFTAMSFAFAMGFTVSLGAMLTVSLSVADMGRAPDRRGKVPQLSLRRRTSQSFRHSHSLALEGKRKTRRTSSCVQGVLLVGISRAPEQCGMSDVSQRDVRRRGTVSAGTTHDTRSKWISVFQEVQYRQSELFKKIRFLCGKTWFNRFSRDLTLTRSQFSRALIFNVQEIRFQPRVVCGVTSGRLAMQSLQDQPSEIRTPSSHDHPCHRVRFFQVHSKIATQLAQCRFSNAFNYRHTNCTVQFRVFHLPFQFAFSARHFSRRHGSSHLSSSAVQVSHRARRHWEAGQETSWVLVVGCCHLLSSGSGTPSGSDDGDGDRELRQARTTQ